ncbi:MAG: hypothetical protein KOO60_00830 [Gemmatimonadales bacterium]|nr:hypothetical protein [Gemmatimonadales bacterium]
MQALFESLNHAVAGSAWLALGASFAWGVLSILLSPCHLASLPLIVAFINGQEGLTTRRAIGLSTLFATGILITIALIGVATAGAGRLMGDLGPIGNYAVAGLFLVLGLNLLGVFSLSWDNPNQPRMRSRGPWAALAMGLVFGIALGPCTFAFMAPMLAVTFQVATGNPVYGGLLLLMYGLGHCLVIGVAGASAELTQRSLNWNADSAGSRILKIVCGILVILAGLYLIYITQ